MAVRVGINGFGRIGRQSLKAIIERTKDVEVVAINDLVDTEMNALLFRYDSTYGRYEGTVDHTEDALIVDGREIKVLKEKDPAAMPWGDLGVDIVIESTGLFTDARQGQGPPRGRRQEGHHQRPGQERGRDHRSRRQRGHVRPGRAQHHQQRVVHDQRPGARGQGAQRHVRHREGLPDHRPLVHELAAPARRRRQGSARRPRRGTEHRSVHDRRGEGRGPGHPRAPGQVHRHGLPRADAHRVGRRLHRASSAAK